MTRPSPSFIALLTRVQLTEMMTPSYAKAKNIDLNESYRRLETSLRSLELIEGLQYAAWRSLETKHADEDADKIVDRVRKRLSKTRRYKAATWKAAEEGAWIALSILIDRGAGVSSGEALDLLETPAGRDLLDRGFDLAGAHLAKELTR